MANYEIFSNAASGLDWTASLQFSVLASSSATLLLQGTDGTVLMLSGAGFTYNGQGRPTGGTISAIRHYNDQALGTLHAEITGLSVSLVTFSGNLDHVGPVVLSGSDTITTHVVGGAVNGYGGGDTINLAGNNFVHATGGSDTIQGVGTPGYDDDWISYEFNPDGSLNTAGVQVVLDDAPNLNSPSFVRQGTAQDLVWFGTVFFAGTNETDALVGIDHIRGSHGNDIILGAQTGGGGGIPPTYSTVYGLGGDDSVQGAQLVYGGEGNDTIAPNSTGGAYYGENGNDTFLFRSIANGDSSILIHGGAGIDTFEFRNLNTNIGIQIDLDSNTAGILGGGGQYWDHWSFISVENIIGGAGSDVLIGTTAANQIEGADSNDYIEGLAGDDVLFGGAGNDVMWGDNDPNGQNGQNPSSGNDTLHGGDGDDALNGGDGDDHLRGGLGADQHIGGAGIDLARYDEGIYGDLTIRLDNPALNVGAAAVGDTYTGIEGVIGGSGNDRIFGDGAANFLHGLGGNDVLQGGGGADYLSGGDGDDHLRGGLGADQHIGGAGIDLARYDEGIYGDLTIRLDNPALNVGAAAVGDTYAGIEGVIGGSGNDRIVGDVADNFLHGLGGNDVLQGGLGNDTLTGGANNDTFVFDTALNAATNVDTIAGFSVAQDTIQLDDAIFTAIGTLAAAAFTIGAAATTAAHHIIYNSATGALIYDSNGSAAGGATQFATLATGLALTNADFVVA